MFPHLVKLFQVLFDFNIMALRIDILPFEELFHGVLNRLGFNRLMFLLPLLKLLETGYGFWT